MRITLEFLDQKEAEKVFNYTLSKIKSKDGSIIMSMADLKQIESKVCYVPPEYDDFDGDMNSIITLKQLPTLTKEDMYYVISIEY